MSDKGWLELPMDDMPENKPPVGRGALDVLARTAGRQSTPATDEEDAYDVEFPDNPVGKFYTRALALDIAMRVATLPEIMEAHKLTYDQLADIMADPGFAAMLKEVHEQTQKEGVSFKLKAQLQAEAMLEDVWELTHNKNVPATVRADLIKSVVKWAGYEPKDVKAQGQGGNTFVIQMNLSGNQPPVARTIDHEE